MIKKYNKVFLLSFFLLLNTSVFGQEDTETKKTQNFPISIALTNQSWALPGSKIFRLAPFYPGISAGSEYHYRARKKRVLYQTLELGGFLNNSAGSALYANTNIGLRLKSDIGLIADFSFGLGYFHGFHPSSIYTLNSLGSYEKAKDKGIGASSANINVILGYKLLQSKSEFTPFIGYQWMASTAYWSLITIRPNGLLKAGIRFNLKNEII